MLVLKSNLKCHLNCPLDQLTNTIYKNENNLVVKKQQWTSILFIQGIFVFCLVWSVGASCDDSGRVKFDAVVREVLTGPLSEETRACHGILATVEAPPKQLTVPLPTEGILHQYRFIKEVGLLLIIGQLRVLCCIL